MPSTIIRLEDRVSLRHKARLNICIAKDLADGFGGRKADYLIRLNHKLRMKITNMIIDDTSIPTLKGKTALGIFKIDGDTLTIASSDPAGQLRPRSFDEPGTIEYISAKD